MRSRRQVVTARALILPYHKSRTYPHKFKCVDGVSEILEETVGAEMYMWDTRSMLLFQSGATKKVSSGKVVVVVLVLVMEVVGVGNLEVVVVVVALLRGVMVIVVPVVLVIVAMVAISEKTEVCTETTVKLRS